MLKRCLQHLSSPSHCLRRGYQHQQQRHQQQQHQQQRHQQQRAQFSTNEMSLLHSPLTQATYEPPSFMNEYLKQISQNGGQAIVPSTRVCLGLFPTPIIKFAKIH